jgi:hypothetical protein
MRPVTAEYLRQILQWLFQPPLEHVRCEGLSRAGNVHTCSTGKVIAVSTFHDSEFPRPKTQEKRKVHVSVRKHRGSRTHCTGKLRAGAARILGVLDQFPRTGAGHPDSRLRASPRILENWTDFKIQISPCRIQLTRLALQFGN